MRNSSKSVSVNFDRYRTTRININRININSSDYYNPEIDYYNPLLRFLLHLNIHGNFVWIIIEININPEGLDYY